MTERRDPAVRPERLSLIVAMARNRVIGRDGTLPWRMSADLQRFKRLTMGHHLLMGRKTWESLGRPLPGRTSIVITRQPDYSATGATVATSFEKAIAIAAVDAEAFVIGGAQIYELALPLVDRLYLTLLVDDVSGDVCFPEFDMSQWRVIEHSHYPHDEKNSYASQFMILDRH